MDSLTQDEKTPTFNLGKVEPQFKITEDHYG